jgi:predicted transcriptional regulator
MAIDRGQTGYNPGQQAVQVLANPNRQDIRVRSDVNESKAFQLAKQLGAGYQGINQLYEHEAKQEQVAAAETVNSLSREDLAQKIKDNDYERIASPVYNATVKNLHFANEAQAQQRDVLTKLNTGELQFKDTAELDSYLLEQRNNTLAGADKYGVAGYDKQWQPFVQQARTDNARILANRKIEEGIGIANDTLRNAIAGPMDNDTLRSKFLESWGKVTEKSGPLLTDKAKKAALVDITYEMARQGHTDGLTHILDTTLDNGISVRGVLGGKEAAQLEYTAMSVAESREAKAQVDQLRVQSESSIQQNNQAIAKAVGLNRAFEIPTEMSYIKPDGSIGYKKTEEDVYRMLNGKTQGMSLSGRLQTFNTNGVVDKESQNVISSGINNLNSITYNEDGKPAGEVNEQFVTAYDTYLTAKMVDPSYAGKLAGDGAKVFEDVEILKQTMGMDTKGAALVVAQARNNPTYINGNNNITKKVDAVVSELNPSWFGRLFGQDEITGNVSNIRADVKRSAELMIAQGASVEATMTALSTYVEKNTANINGSLVYLRSVPASSRSSEIVGGSVTQLKRLHDQIGTDIALQQGHDPKDVTMTVSKDGGMYTFLAKGQPIMTGNRPMVLTKSQVEEWMERDFDNYKTDKRLDPARNKFAEEIKDQYMGGRSSKYMPQDKYLMSQPGYRRLVEAGLDKKPLKEQRAWAKKQVEQGATWHAPATPVKDYSTKGDVQKSLAPGEEVVNQ